MNIYKKDFPKSGSVVPQKRERKIVIIYKSSSFQKHYFSLALAKEYSKLIAAKEITKSIKKNSKN